MRVQYNFGVLVDYRTLASGDCFQVNDEMCMKTSDGEACVSLETGDIFEMEDMDAQVRLVDATVVIK